jgi:D-3-phosphoglycerate dehydrogenase
LTLTTDTQVRAIAGSLFNKEPRIVKIKNIPMDATLGQNMLYITNTDQPGLIGRLGTVLGNAGINIATFHLGRAEPGGNAIALLEIDEAPSKIVMDEILALDLVLQAIPLKF